MAMTSDGGPAVRPFGRISGPALDRSVFLRPIAHRGLHNAERIENTAPAFLAAVDKGYGIECDLQSAADGTPMVFHDSKLDRLVEGSGPIAMQTPEQLARLRYKRQNIPILTFAQLLELVGGRVPLLVEVKRNGRPPPPRYLSEIARLASAYRGPIALMSFEQPMVVSLGSMAPNVPRGLVVGTHLLKGRWLGSLGKTRKRAAVARLLDASPPHLSFLAVEVKMLPEAAQWVAHNPEKLALFSWTIRTPAERAIVQRCAAMPIFEGYEPPIPAPGQLAEAGRLARARS